MVLFQEAYLKQNRLHEKIDGIKFRKLRTEVISKLEEMRSDEKKKI